MAAYSGSTLHIISFDVPYPADYGGVMDIYHKIRWMKKLNIHVILHCFQYGRKEAPELNKLCKKVYYYPRRKYLNPFVGQIPYIVKSRDNSELIMNLTKDNAPILFEGIHTTFYINHIALRKRKKFLRSHNVEHDYYKGLEKAESNFFKKYFFRNETDLLQTYEPVILNMDGIFSISPSDNDYMNAQYGNSQLISAFHPNDKVSCRSGKGEFILYHGNLGVGENNFSARFLVGDVFPHIDFPIYIAGNNPSDTLVKMIANYPHISLEARWSNKRILDAVADAQINVLPTFQSTGIKLKLLNSLYLGRHCLVNSPMVVNTGLENLCHIADSAEDMVRMINDMLDVPFTDEEIKKRKLTLPPSFGNLENAEKMANLIFGQ